MAIAHLLEDFSTSEASEGPIRLMSEDALEDMRLTSFEQGYTAGWDDAIKAQAEDQTRISAALAQSLEDMSFTYQEAFSQMLGTVEPVFQALVNSVLPGVMADVLGHQIVAQLCEMARDQAAQPASVVVPVGAGAALRPILAREYSMPVDLVEDPALDHGRACLRIGSTEREIDSDRLLASIREAVEAFFYQTNKDAQHG